MWRAVVAILLVGCGDRDLLVESGPAGEAEAQKTIDVEGHRDDPNRGFGFSMQSESYEASMIRYYLVNYERTVVENDSEAGRYYAEKIAWLLVAVSSFSEQSVKEEVLEQLARIPEEISGVPISSSVMFPDEYEFALRGMISSPDAQGKGLGRLGRVPAIGDIEPQAFGAILHEAIARMESR